MFKQTLEEVFSLIKVLSSKATIPKYESYDFQQRVLGNFAVERAIGDIVLDISEEIRRNLSKYVEKSEEPTECLEAYTVKLYVLNHEEFLALKIAVQEMLYKIKELERENTKLKQCTREVKEAVYACIDEDYNAWECSVCEEAWELNNGTPSENKMRFCPFCGARIVEERHPFVEDLEE